jgi:hypothetical protein
LSQSGGHDEAIRRIGVEITKAGAATARAPSRATSQKEMAHKAEQQMGVEAEDRGGGTPGGDALRPFMVKPQAYLVLTRSVFNRIVGDQGFELAFAEFFGQLPRCGELREKRSGAGLQA